MRWGRFSCIPYISFQRHLFPFAFRMMKKEELVSKISFHTWMQCCLILCLHICNCTLESNKTVDSSAYCVCAHSLLLANVYKLTFTFVTFAMCCRPSVCLSSVTLVHPTQPMAFGNVAIRWHPRKILRRLSQGNIAVGGVKHKRGSQI